MTPDSQIWLVRLPDDMSQAIRWAWERCGELIDPHTAVGVSAMRAAGIPRDVPRIALATAHPAKFPDAVEKATGRRPALPPALANLFDLPERFTKLPNDLDQVKRFLKDKVIR